MKEINLPKTIAEIILYAKRKWIFSVLFLLVITAIYVKLFLLKETQHTVEYTLTSSEIPSSYIESIVKPVKNNISNRDAQLNQEILAIDQSTAERITDLEVTFMRGKDASTLGSSITIQLSGFSTESIDAFGVAFVNYLNTNELITRYRRVYGEQLDESFTTINEQLTRIDSLQSTLPQMVDQKMSTEELAGLLELSGIYEQMIKIQASKTEIEREIELNKEFKLVSKTHFSSKKQSLIVKVVGLLLVNLTGLIGLFYLNLLIGEVRNNLEDKG